MTLPKSSLQRYDKGFRTPEKNPSKILGRFSQNGVPGVTIIDGTGFTVAYTGVGTYTISTVSTDYTDLISCTALVEAAAAGVDMNVNISAITSAIGAVTTVELTSLTGGVATEVPNNDEIHFELNLVSSGLDV